jgi:hypothetical protein
MKIVLVAIVMPSLMITVMPSLIIMGKRRRNQNCRYNDCCADLVHEGYSVVAAPDGMVTRKRPCRFARSRCKFASFVLDLTEHSNCPSDWAHKLFINSSKSRPTTKTCGALPPRLTPSYSEGQRLSVVWLRCVILSGYGRNSTLFRTVTAATT